MRTGLVRLAFHPGQLGCVVEHEKKSRHYRSWSSGFDGGLSSFQGRRGPRRSRSRSRLRRRYFANRYLQRFPFRHRWAPFFFKIQSGRRPLDRDFAERHASAATFLAHFLRRKIFSYPLKPFEALVKLGVLKSTLCVFSWLKARLFPVRNPRNFEEWVSNQFGKRLFNTFFKSYTEKVWGMSCREICS